MSSSQPLDPETVLQDTSLDPAERVMALFQSGQWEEERFHRFACDCAERALKVEQQHGREPASVSWDAIQLKRMWLQGQASDEELKEVVSKVRSAAHQASIAHACYEATTAAADAASEVSYVARTAAWALASITKAVPPEAEEATREQETTWQLNHLLVLLTESKTNLSNP